MFASFFLRHRYFLLLDGRHFFREPIGFGSLFAGWVGLADFASDLIFSTATAISCLLSLTPSDTDLIVVRIAGPIKGLIKGFITVHNFFQPFQSILWVELLLSISKSPEVSFWTHVSTTASSKWTVDWDPRATLTTCPSSSLNSSMLIYPPSSVRSLCSAGGSWLSKKSRNFSGSIVTVVASVEFTVMVIPMSSILAITVYPSLTSSCCRLRPYVADTLAPPWIKKLIWFGIFGILGILGLHLLLTSLISASEDTIILPSLPCTVLIGPTANTSFCLSPKPSPRPNPKPMTANAMKMPIIIFLSWHFFYCDLSSLA